MIYEILTIIFFLIPAGIANMAPVLVKKINFLNYPIDFGKKISGDRIFGENKTYRGFFFGILLSIIAALIQKSVYPTDLSVLVNYNEVNVFLLGFLLGFGALFGDLVKSFFKRRLKIKPGKSWVPFDQIDWVIGALLFASLYVSISLKLWIIGIVVFGILHPIVNYAGFLLKIKKNKF